MNLTSPKPEPMKVTVHQGTSEIAIECEVSPCQRTPMFARLAEAGADITLEDLVRLEKEPLWPRGVAGARVIAGAHLVAVTSVRNGDGSEVMLDGEPARKSIPFLLDSWPALAMLVAWRAIALGAQLEADRGN